MLCSIFLVTVTSVLVSRIMVSRSHLHYLRQESKIWCVDTSLDGGVLHTILVTVTMTLILECSVVGNVSVCRSRGCEFRLILLWYNFYSHSTPSR